MIERDEQLNAANWRIESNAMRHPGTTLSSFHDSFYLSHLSRDPRLANVCVGAGWNSAGVIYCSRVRARGVRGVTSTSRICNKEDRCDGRNIAGEANLLLFHFARSSSLIRYSLESTLFHRRSDMVRVAFRWERLDNVARGVGSIRNVNLPLLPLLQ